MSINVIYLAGPMRNKPNFNFPAFAYAAGILRDAGYDVINPAEHDLEQGFNPETDTEDALDWTATVAWDLEQILHRAEAVVVLPGWESSTGTRGELAVAMFKGIPIKEFTGFVKLQEIPYENVRRRGAEDIYQAGYNAGYAACRADIGPWG